jgi:hypothetical protein
MYRFGWTAGQLCVLAQFSYHPFKHHSVAQRGGRFYEAFSLNACVNRHTSALERRVVCEAEVGGATRNLEPVHSEIFQRQST